MDTQFVRIKNSANETFFVTCRPRDLVSLLKESIHAMNSQAPEDMRLYIRNRLLEDDSSLYDQQVINDCELFLVSKTPQGDWENISIFMNRTDTGFNRGPESPLR